MQGAQKFDPKARLFVSQAQTVADLRQQLGDVGLVNGPRVGVGRRTTVSNEAYLVRRLVLELADNGDLTFPVTIEHVDGPDFILWQANTRVPLEVTEACPAEEGRQAAVEDDGCHDVGDYSETGTDKALADLQAQLQESIDRKATKSYARDQNAALLIYPNSDAALWVRLFFKDRPFPLFGKLRISPFEKVYIMWLDERFVCLADND